jgi:uncharacterized protein YkwD
MLTCHRLFELANFSKSVELFPFSDKHAQGYQITRPPSITFDVVQSAFCSGSSFFTGLRQFQEDCLLAHNKYRQRHTAPPLQWSYKLANEAQKWAQHLLDSGQFTHSENIVYGENLAGRKGYDLNGKKATKLWYDESRLFNFEDPSFSPDTGNFSQV